MRQKPQIIKEPKMMQCLCNACCLLVVATISIKMSLPVFVRSGSSSVYCTFHVSLGIGIITNRVNYLTQTHFFTKIGQKVCLS